MKNFVLTSLRVFNLRVFILMLVLVLTLFGCGPGNPGTPEIDPAAHPVQIRVADVVSTTLRPSVEVVGALESIPERTAQISSKVGGQIKTISIVEGDLVHAGQVIIQLDSSLAESEVDKDASLVEESNAVLEKLKIGNRPQEIEIAEHNEKRARLAVETLRSKVQATKLLHDKGEVSTIEFESLNSSLASAEADLKAASAKLELMKAGTRHEEISEAEAKLKVAKADLAAAKLMVKFCRIASPIDGVVTEVKARLGVFADSTQSLARVEDHSKLFARFRIPSLYLSEIETGALVDVFVSSLPGNRFRGSVKRLSSKADKETGGVDAFAEIENVGGLLRPGLECRVVVQLPEIKDAIAIPVEAVSDKNGTAVVTVVKDSKAYEVEIKTGIQANDQVQVLSGLSAGDVVAVEGGYGLPEGCPVKGVAQKSSPR